MSSDAPGHAKHILDTMLGYLGFVVRIEPDSNHPANGLQVFTEEAETLVGRGGARLEDIQYLVNRLMQARDPDAPRMRIDIEHYRAMREDGLLEEISALADRVRVSGKPIKLDPMNSYQRRMVHNAFKDDPVITTWSPSDRGRLKRITLMRRKEDRAASSPKP